MDINPSSSEAIDFSPSTSDSSGPPATKKQKINNSLGTMSTTTIDNNLYSRQIGAYGIETMGRLMKMNILIAGLRGAGVETAKNLILAGPQSVTLHDNIVVELRDLSSNFYLSPSDVGIRSRAAAVVGKLAELNNYVAVNVCDAVDLADSTILRNFDFVVLFNFPLASQIAINNICRSLSVGFIAADCLGLAAGMFVDFGEEFILRSNDGEEPKGALVAGITTECPNGIVYVHNDKPMPFQDGDWVTFREILGTVELNNSDPRRIKIHGPHSFYIEDTSKYGPYEREGIIQEVKVPEKIKFSSRETCRYRPLACGQDCLPTPDLSKFGRSEQLHFAFLAIHEYRKLHGKFPSTRDPAAVAECIQLARQENEICKKLVDKVGVVSVESIEEAVVDLVANFCLVEISPISSFVGGVVAQEIVKFTGRFTPIRQLLYVDFVEMLPPYTVDDWQPINSRYDDQIAIFGRQFQAKMENQKIFLVGAGALGCEFLKSFALMGLCTGPQGKLTVTDMDSIEISNLNRQFLFRRHQVGKFKSTTAAEAAKSINPALNVIATQTRVGVETEDVFTDNFWDSLDCVVNALDNVPSRLYVDSRCVWHHKPLLESGTLGTKANVQVVLPSLTECYGESQDPPEESIPLCTLKHFPHLIEHTIEWARDAFHGVFTDGPQESLTFLKDREGFLKKISMEGGPSSQREKLEKIFNLINVVSNGIPSFEHCVRLAVDLFLAFFNFQIRQLLYNFPADHKTAEGSLFWSGPKRQPMALDVDVSDPAVFGFIFAAANLYAKVFDVPEIFDQCQVAMMVRQTVFKAFTPQKVVIKTDEKDANTQEGAEDDEYRRQELSNQLGSIDIANQLGRIGPLEFEKDDDKNHHIDFIHFCANLRARNYRISECDRHKTKLVAGKIIPAVATTTAMVTGLVSVELVKVITKNQRKLEDFKNSFVNMSLPLWLFSEPMPPQKATDKDYDPVVLGPIRARPPNFTAWDKIVFDIPNGTLRQVLDRLRVEFQVDAAVISSGSTLVYNSYIASHKLRLDQQLKSLIETVTKSQLKNSYVVLEASCQDIGDQVDVVIPSIKVSL